MLLTLKEMHSRELAINSLQYVAASIIYFVSATLHHCEVHTNDVVFAQSAFFVFMYLGKSAHLTTGASRVVLSCI